MANDASHKPKRSEDAMTQAGLKALDLVTQHKEALTPRLPAGVVDGLTNDLVALGVAVPAAVQAQTAAQAATSSQYEALASGYAIFSAVRAAVVQARASSAVRKAYGVGMRVNAKVVKDVQAALGTVLARAEAQPEEAASFGLLTKDLDVLKADVLAIGAADVAQEGQRASAPLTTKARNRTAQRVIEATDRIAGAGILEFAKNPSVRAEFEALVGVGNRKGKKKKKDDQPA